jgi:signal transduction histidine kinase
MPIFISQRKYEVALAKQVSEVCDNIIKEIGAEIHDDLIQKLSVFRLDIDRMESSSRGNSELQALAIKMRNDFEHVIRTIKVISRKLLPTHMEGESFISLVELLCQNLEQPGVVNIHFKHIESFKVIEDDKIHLLRIIQELIYNAVKHSSAWHIWVRLISDANSLIIEVEDDGTGNIKISEFIDLLKKKNNTLKIRTKAIGATIDYLQGSKGLLARVKLNPK